MSVKVFSSLTSADVFHFVFDRSLSVANGSAIQLVNDRGEYLGKDGWQKASVEVLANCLTARTTHLEVILPTANAISAGSNLSITIPSIEHREALEWPSNLEAADTGQRRIRRGAGPHILVLVLLISTIACVVFLLDRAYFSVRERFLLSERSAEISRKAADNDRKAAEIDQKAREIDSRSSRIVTDRSELDSNQRAFQGRVNSWEKQKSDEARRLNDTKVDLDRQKIDLDLLQRKLNDAINQPQYQPYPGPQYPPYPRPQYQPPQRPRYIP